MQKFLRLILVATMDLSLIFAILYFINTEGDKGMIAFGITIVSFLGLFFTRDKRESKDLESEYDEIYFDHHKDKSDKIV